MGKFKGVEKMRDRESIFNEHMSDIRKKEKDEKIAKERQIRKDFFGLLKERNDVVDRHAHWSDVKKALESDARYKAVDSSSQKEDWFLDHMHDIKEEHRREKEKKKRERSRSPRKDDRKKDRKRSKSRSKSRDKERSKKDKKKDKKDPDQEALGQDRGHQKKPKKKKKRGRGRKKNEKKRKEKERKEKETKKREKC